MINYNRLAYELKRDISNFSNKISVGFPSFEVNTIKFRSKIGI